MKYIKGLDTIRAIAILIVIVDKYHWGPDFPEHTLPYYIKSVFIPNGRFGVTLFFVLSGFLISSILLREKERIETTKQSFVVMKNFYARRILRIFPIYYLLVFLCYFLNYQFVRQNIAYFLTYTSNFLYDHNNPLLHTWSLAVEEQFYLLWPWLIIFLNKKYLKYLFIACVCIGVASRYTELYIYHHDANAVFSHFDSFGIGGMYAYARQMPATRQKFEKYFRIAIVPLLFISWRLNIATGVPTSVIYFKLMKSVVALALIMFTVNNDIEWIRKYLLENKVLNFIGKISYGLYLYHFTLGTAFDNFVHRLILAHPGLPGIITNFYAIYCIKFGLLILISWLSFRFIEQPIMRLKLKFRYI